jgi:hypothetical protein
MPEYEEILAFLAANPPRQARERELHASLLELIARCLRADLMESEEAEGAADETLSLRLRPADLN